MKINLGGTTQKKEFFPISFDSSTTSNFGECVPTFFQEVVAGSHLRIDLRSAVRFAPLTLPTFGMAYLHSYAFYHKFCDLWKPYNDFLARTPYSNGSGFSYVPTQVPSLPLSYLWFIVLCHSKWSLWKVTSGSVVNPASSPLNVGSYSVTPEAIHLPSAVKQFNDGLVRTLASVVLKSSPLSRPLATYLDNPSRSSNLVWSRSGSSSSPSTFVSADDPDAVTPAGSDFMLDISSENLYQMIDGNFTNEHISTGRRLLCLKLNNSGKFLRKIFMGLGYQLKNLDLSVPNVSMLPLFAFFKSYFSTFAPKRYIKYDQTFFGRVMTVVENTGNSLTDVLFSDTAFSKGGCPLAGFIDDLLSCFYTQDTDYYSSQIIGLVNDYGNDIDQRYISVDSEISPTVESVTSLVGNNSTPFVSFSEGLTHTQSQQNVLSRLTNFVNRRSLVGGKIADLLQSVFGISKQDVLDDDNPYIGSSVLDVDFSDVFSTAETAEGSLGEYAGRALGRGSDKFTVDCSSPGIVLAFSTVVPRTQKVQGVNPFLFHVSPSDYYNPQFDGITLLPTSKLSLYCVDSIADVQGAANFTRSFGNQSLFAEYKMRTQGILNGDLSLMSTKSSYDSFTMDQTIANYVAQDSTSEDGTVNFTLTSPNSARLSAGTMWRYIGRWLWLGNFDRIFLNTRQQYSTDYPDYADITWSSRDTHVTDDNLIVHNIVDLKINAPMLPLEDSYMTRDLEELRNGFGVRSQGE
nr:unnamed protein product [uncultured bacterium]